MPTVMPHDPGRARKIRELMKNQEDDAGGKAGLSKAKLIVKGRVELLPIYQFRLTDLYYNKANGRIKAEVSAVETQLGRHIDITDDVDKKRIKNLLLSIRRDENEKIREDLKQNGQMQPGIITCDGIIINGNRRHALLEELYSETHEEKFNTLEVQILPSDITKSEVWLIEAGIQLSTPQQLDYSPINHLLKLREGVDSGLDVSVMAQRIYGIDESRLERDLARLKLIDEYLEHYLLKPGHYHLIDGLAEHFIDLQNILEWLEKPKGPVRRDWYPNLEDINELKLVAFHYIRAKFAHLRIRDLRDLFCRKSAWDDLRNSLDIKIEVEKLTPIEVKNDLDELEIEGDLEFESKGDSVVITGEVVEAEKRKEKSWQKQVINDLKSNFEDAMEQLNIEKHREKPLDLARRALRRLEGIPEDSEELSKPELNRVFGKIISRVNLLRKIGHKQRQTSAKPQSRQHKKKKSLK
jgi:hypothetical protein